MREFARGPKAGDHDYHGACVPKHEVAPWRVDTFSVGVFRYRVSATGILRSTPVIVRIRGKVTEAEQVYAAAEAVCKWLDWLNLIGDYHCPKSMNWDKVEAWLQAQQVEHGELDSRFSVSCGTVCGKE